MNEGIELPIARYRLSFEITQTMRLPAYAGSALRGAFGHALRHLACVTRAQECDDCSVLEQCPYALVFEPHGVPRSRAISFGSMRQVPVPYIIEPPSQNQGVLQVGDSIQFNMVLMGEALQQLPLILLAWRRAFMRGIGATEGKGKLAAVDCLTASGEALPVYQLDDNTLLPHTSRLPLPLLEQADLHLELLTPLRIEQHKKPLGARQLTAPIFLRHLVRRVALLGELYFDRTLPDLIGADVSQLNALCDTIADDRRLRWRDWQRYSGRQRQAMKLGGVTGRWLLRAVPQELQTCVYLGQWLHAGKETVFGLGGYRISDQLWSKNQLEGRHHAV